MVVLDTNVIIDHIRQNDPYNSYLFKLTESQGKNSLGISIISIQELYEGKSTRNKEKEEYLLSIISKLKIFSYTYDVAKLAGTIARDIGKPVDLPDVAIAATAILNNCQLFTLNQKDFEGIKELQMFNP